MANHGHIRHKYSEYVLIKKMSLGVDSSTFLGKFFFSPDYIFFFSLIILFYPIKTAFENTWLRFFMHSSQLFGVKT